MIKAFWGDAGKISAGGKSKLVQICASIPIRPREWPSMMEVIQCNQLTARHESVLYRMLVLLSTVAVIRSAMARKGLVVKCLHSFCPCALSRLYIGTLTKHRHICWKRLIDIYRMSHLVYLIIDKPLCPETLSWKCPWAHTWSHCACSLNTSPEFPLVTNVYLVLPKSLANCLIPH